MTLEILLALVAPSHWLYRSGCTHRSRFDGGCWVLLFWIGLAQLNYHVLQPLNARVAMRVSERDDDHEGKDAKPLETVHDKLPEWNTEPLAELPAWN